MKFRLADLCDDAGLLKAAFAGAGKLIESDPELREHPVLAERVAAMFTLDADSLN